MSHLGRLASWSSALRSDDIPADSLRAGAPSCWATASAAKTAEWQVWPIHRMSSKSWVIAASALATAAPLGDSFCPVKSAVALPAPNASPAARTIRTTAASEAAPWTAATMLAICSRAARLTSAGIRS